MSSDDNQSTVDTVDTPRPLRHPSMREVAVIMAELYGVCSRPVPKRRVDPETGETTIVAMPCGSRRESVCRSCAAKIASTRRTQALEGWHLTEEPTVATREPTAEELATMVYRAGLEEARARAAEAGDEKSTRELDSAIDQADAMLRAEGLRGSLAHPAAERRRPKRRVRSTRRRQDVPNLPAKQMSSQTIGQVYVGADGKEHRPSTFVTGTLDSYGRVHEDGSPVDPDSYDYRRAARDAIHFGDLLDRLWTNLRRVSGFDLQYFAAVEPQRRGAPHVHVAFRGTFARKLIRAVIEATYFQVWWPPHDVPVYVDRLPVWDETRDEPCYVDPDTHEPLPTWKQAMDRTDADPNRQPAHVVRFGKQMDIQGVAKGTKRASKCLTYLVKYLTKSISECYRPETERAQRHVDRMTETLRFEPCSETCPNWLRYGVQPKHAHRGQIPGCCKGKAHQPENLGYGGRRCLVSRKWSGKKLSDHIGERRDKVLRTLGAVGATPELVTPDGQAKRYRWEGIKPTDPDYPPLTQLILRTVAERQRFREQYERSKAELSATRDQAA